MPTHHRSGTRRELKIGHAGNQHEFETQDSARGAQNGAGDGLLPVRDSNLLALLLAALAPGVSYPLSLFVVATLAAEPLSAAQGNVDRCRAEESGRADGRGADPRPFGTQ